MLIMSLFFNSPLFRPFCQKKKVPALGWDFSYLPPYRLNGGFMIIGTVPVLYWSFLFPSLSGLVFSPELVLTYLSHPTSFYYNL